MYLMMITWVFLIGVLLVVPFAVPFVFMSVYVVLSHSGSDVNSPRRPGTNGEGGEEARDGQSPLHLASCWGLDEVVQCLLEFGANVNVQVLTPCTGF